MVKMLAEIGIEAAMILATIAAIACFLYLMVLIVRERREIRRLPAGTEDGRTHGASANRTSAGGGSTGDTSADHSSADGVASRTSAGAHRNGKPIGRVRRVVIHRLQTGLAKPS